MNSCSYIHVLDTAAKGHAFNGYVSGSEINLDGTKWTFTANNPSFKFGNYASGFGLPFGTSGNPTNGLTIETVDSYHLNMIYAKISCASQKTVNYRIYIGDTLLFSGSVTRPTGATSSEIVGCNFAAANGRIKIVIDGNDTSSGAVIVHTLAYNVA